MKGKIYLNEVEIVLSGILGLTCLSTIIVVFYILRNYSLMEDHRDNMEEQMDDIQKAINQLMEENKRK